MLTRMCKFVTDFVADSLVIFTKIKAFSQLNFSTTCLTDLPRHLINIEGLIEFYRVDLQYIRFTVYIFTSGEGGNLKGKYFSHLTL